jgi:hypothetical protein
MRKSKKLMQNIIDAIADGATVTGTCKQIKITPKTFYRWKKEDFLFSQEVDEAIEMKENKKNDLAENSHIQLIKEGCWLAIKYQLTKRDYRKKENKEQVHKTPILFHRYPTSDIKEAKLIDAKYYKVFQEEIERLKKELKIKKKK